MTYKLREHQSRAIAKLRESIGKGKRCPVLMASTGFGKTLIAIDMIKSALNKGNKVMFVVDRVTLIDQTSKEFDKHGIDHGIIQADHWRTNDLPVQIASVQTLVRRRDKPYANLVIVDEAHCMWQGMNEIIKNWTGVKFIGLSATPFAKGMGKVFDDLIQVETTQSLIDKGYLSDFIAYGSVELNLDGIQVQAGDYNQKQLGQRVNTKKLVGDVVKTWLKKGENRKTVCFATNVAHSKSIVDELNAYGVTAEHIDAKTKPEDRDAILMRHDSGETKIISNVGITTKGWDSPDTSCIILARPTKSLMLYLQMVGRVLRTHPDKQNAIILDHGRNIERLGFPTDPLPDYLCDGEKDTQQKKKKEEREREEKAPKPCPACNFLKTSFKCPSCGHEPMIKPEVESTDHELKVIERHSMESKQHWYSMFMQHARQKGYNPGWVAHKYREKFGVWPKGLAKIPASTTPEFKKYIQHLNIKRAKMKDIRKLKNSWRTA